MAAVIFFVRYLFASDPKQVISGISICHVKRPVWGQIVDVGFAVLPSLLPKLFNTSSHQMDRSICLSSLLIKTDIIGRSLIDNLNIIYGF